MLRHVDGLAQGGVDHLAEGLQMLGIGLALDVDAYQGHVGLLEGDDTRTGVGIATLTIVGRSSTIQKLAQSLVGAGLPAMRPGQAQSNACAGPIAGKPAPTG
ncbi:hypothetical protein GCM10011247_14340 [Pseudomonas plecoglossicida]|nr:hypothetical protein GCM10011247_14340 [Pseudomonas plecoglossicida]